MTLNDCFKAKSLIFIAALVISPNLVNQASAQERQSFLIDLNSRTATAIGALNGGYSEAFGINDAGQVVGFSTGNEGTRAFITGPNGIGMRDLGTLNGFSIAHGINNAGRVVGESPPDAFITGPD